MLKVSLKNLWSHKRRLIGTVLAVVIGVAFLTGTLTLGSTLESNFDDLFTEVNAGTDAVIRNETQLDSDYAPAAALIDASLVDDVRATEGVAAAEGTVDGFGRLHGRDGEGLGGNGPPTLASSWIEDPDLNPYRIAEGRPPEGSEEVVINRGAAEDGDLSVGDTTIVETPDPVEATIVGISTFGDADGLGGVTSTAFTLEGAQTHLTKRPGEVTRIVVKAEPGVSQDELVRSLRAELPDGIEVISGDALTDEGVEDINATFLDMLRMFLLVFAIIALLVATFSIYNTFSIIVAQRTRDAALLRALGASRRQVLASVGAEAVVVGVVASLIGIVGGIGFAGLLKGLFDSFGFVLPAGGLVITTTTLVVAFVVGVLVTALAGVFPAIRASRVAPLAALRQVAVDRAGSSTVRAVTGLTLAAVGAGVVMSSVLGEGGGDAILVAGVGAIVLAVGIVVFGPVIAGPAAALLGAPLARLRGVPGGLARRNAVRNPKRTSSTAAALMVGVGVVTLFTVFAASLKATIDTTVSEGFAGDLVISSGPFGGSGYSPQLATDIGAIPEVSTAVGVGTDGAEIGGESKQISAAEPADLDAVLDLDVVDGSIADLAPDEIGVSEGVADRNNWTVGSEVAVTFSDAAVENMRVGAIYEGNELLGGYLIPRATWEPHAVQAIDATVYVDVADGVSVADGERAVEEVAEGYGDPDVLTRDEFVDVAAGAVNLMLGIVYALLALTILIALMGIANTLSLSIHERTRELGLLRAVGETRGQVRAMVRWESVIVAVFGTVGGLAFGAFLGWALVQSAGSDQDFTFAAPFTQLVIVLVVGALAGLLAGLRPARRAARLDVLQAVATE